MHERIPLAEKSRDAVLRHVRRLWGYEVNIVGYDPETDKELYQGSTASSDEGKEKDKGKDES
jgi:spore cortex formation protein SpoVR/YcgB (stage V sporulation)